MIIGNFKFDPKRDTFVGEIKTLTLLRGKVQLRSVNKTKEKEPDYRLVEDGPSGTVELGAAWKRTSKTSSEFFSVILDDPALPRPFNAALMPSEDGASAILIWSRQPRKEKTE